MFHWPHAYTKEVKQCWRCYSQCDYIKEIVGTVEVLWKEWHPSICSICAVDQERGGLYDDLYICRLHRYWLVAIAFHIARITWQTLQQIWGLWETYIHIVSKYSWHAALISGQVLQNAVMYIECKRQRVYSVVQRLTVSPLLVTTAAKCNLLAKADICSACESVKFYCE